MYEEEIHFGKLFLKQFEMAFEHLTPVTLTPKSIGFICYPGWMCGPRLKKIGQGVLELLIRNEKVTNRQTDRPTCAKQFALFFEGWHKNRKNKNNK